MKRRIPLLVAVIIILASSQACKRMLSSDEIYKLHKELNTIDSHTDTPLRMMRQGTDLAIRTDPRKNGGKVDLVRMEEGGLDGIFFAVFVLSSPAFSNQETDEINAAIKEKKAKWTAGETTITKLSAKDIIQRRRSAQRFDGITTVEKDEFLRMLDMLIPRRDTPPWDAISWQPRIHVVLFIHRVKGLEPGLYILIRNESAIDSLKANLSDKMEWLPIEKTPDHLNFYRLVKANAQNASATLSCHQHIASDGAFSLGMLSEFDAALETSPCVYKHLYWEAGILGHILYLEAEAIDLQGTGIGCYFDDAFHELLGITDTQFQSVYHFTVGAALNDSRLRTILPYEHIRRD